MAPDRLTAGLNRDNREQRADAGGSSLTGFGALEHKKEFLAKLIPASRHLLTWRRLLVAVVAALILVPAIGAQPSAASTSRATCSPRHRAATARKDRTAVWALVIPWIKLTLNTVSTDDAFVNGHVTFVAARVSGQVSRVLVDDNNRVQKGELLAELDKEPYRTAVAVKQAAVDIAKTELRVATSMAHGFEAQARSQRWKLQHAIEDVENRVALLHARVAALDKRKAALSLAQLEFERAQQLLPTSVTTRAEFDRRQAALSIARADVTQALADVYQIRVSLGLAAQPERGGDLVQVSPDLDQTFSSVLQAQADLISSAAKLGVVHSYAQRPKEMIEEFEKLDPQGDIDRMFAQLAKEVPAVKQAEAKLESANRDLAQAELDLRYCDIIAEIDGVVTQRNINPGNNVQVGQSLMAIRSLREVWIDANFKETPDAD